MIIPLILTIVIELPIVAAIVHSRRSLLLLVVIGMNLITLPVATTVYYEVLPNLLVVETGVSIAEGLILRAVLEPSWSRSITASLVANTSSAVIGLILSAYHLL